MKQNCPIAAITRKEKSTVEPGSLAEGGRPKGHQVHFNVSKVHLH